MTLRIRPDVQARVSGVSGGSQCGKRSWAEAVEVYRAAYNAGLVRVDPKAGGPFDKPGGWSEEAGEDIEDDGAQNWHEEAEALFRQLKM